MHKFGVTQLTHHAFYHAKFTRIGSSRRPRGAKHPKSYHIFNFNILRWRHLGYTRTKLNAGAQRSNSDKIISTFKYLNGEVVSTTLPSKKCDGQKEKKTSNFFVLWRRAKSKPYDSWRDGRGGLCHFCTRKRACTTHSLPLKGR